MSFYRIWKIKVSEILLMRLMLFLIVILSFICLLTFYFHMKKAVFISFHSSTHEHSGRCLPLTGTRSGLFNDTYVLNSDLCKGGKTKLLILVFSAPQNFISREVIRNTWGSTKNDSISIGFLLGRVNSSSLQQEIKEEFEANCDIIQDDWFLDNYRTLTAKAISMLRWANFYCKEAEGVLRGADDIWLNQEKALELLISNYGKEGIYGVVVKGGPTVRDPNSKSYVPFDIYYGTHYPDYVQGHAFLVIRGKERNLFELMVNASRSAFFVQLEDVDIGFMAEDIKIQRFHIKDFHEEKVLPLDKSIYEKLITSHHITDEEKYFLWRRMKNKQNKPYKK